MNQYQLLHQNDYDVLLPLYGHFNGRPGMRRVEHHMKTGIQDDTELVLAFGDTLMSVRPVHHDKTPNQPRQFVDKWNHFAQGELEDVIDRIEKLLAKHLKVHPPVRRNFWGK
jgi:hypothetical protein